MVGVLGHEQLLLVPSPLLFQGSLPHPRHRGSFLCRLHRGPLPCHLSPTPPQAGALCSGTTWRGAPSHTTALPPTHQGLPDPHGPQPQGRQEAGQLLQCHHLQQPPGPHLRASQAEGGASLPALCASGGPAMPPAPAAPHPSRPLCCHSRSSSPSSCWTLLLLLPQPSQWDRAGVGEGCGRGDLRELSPACGKVPRGERGGQQGGVNPPHSPQGSLPQLVHSLPVGPWWVPERLGGAGAAL